MNIKIFGSLENTTALLEKVDKSLEELGLVDFIKVEVTQDIALKEELQIVKEPALIVVEESIDFKDTIFEGIIPEDEEIKAMFISIIGWGSAGWCGSKDESGSCGTGCAC